MPEDIKSANWNTILLQLTTIPKILRYLHKLINSTASITLVYVSKKFPFEVELGWFGFRKLLKMETGINDLEFELKEEKVSVKEDGLMT